MRQDWTNKVFTMATRHLVICSRAIHFRKQFSNVLSFHNEGIFSITSCLTSSKQAFGKSSNLPVALSFKSISHYGAWNNDQRILRPAPVAFIICTNIPTSDTICTRFMCDRHVDNVSHAHPNSIIGRPIREVNCLKRTSSKGGKLVFHDECVSVSWPGAYSSFYQTLGQSWVASVDLIGMLSHQ